jgi:hypothetical protein
MPACPLDMADPDRHAGQLRRVGVHLQPQHGLRSHLRELALRAEGFGLNHRLMLQILERQQREVEEVAGTAGGVQHPEGAQPVDEAAQQRLGLLGGVALDLLPSLAAAPAVRVAAI